MKPILKTKADDWLLASPATAIEMPPTQEQYWKILIVDDEESVHSVTNLALNSLLFNNKKLKFFSAFSAAEAKTILASNPDIAVILLDVVMEEDDAGLKLAQYIRYNLANWMVRIILRTGQPGQAPEEKVILEYDINDYKEKTELTSRKLYSAMITALRSYQDLDRINHSKLGLEKIVEATATIFAIQSITKFAAGVLEQLAALLNITGSALCVHYQSLIATRERLTDFLVLAGTGDFTKVIGLPISAVLPAHVNDEIKMVFKNSSTNFHKGKNYVLFKSKQGSEGVLYLENNKNLNDFDQNLIDIFCVNICVAFDNLELSKEIEETQRDCIYTLGEAAEARSQETGNHVKRVAECCWLLANKCGLSCDEAALIRMASPMHDIGKLAIPDSILNKPGKLTSEEFTIMKNHCQIGYYLMKKSPRAILQTAAMIAYQHHEKFDGTGYPNQLKETQIHIFSRITALIDVFDALHSNRVYKKAWPLPEILTLLDQEKSKHFDPTLVDIFLENLDEFLIIYQQLPD